MAAETQKVELHQAWCWDCPECGRENFARSVTADLTREEKIEYSRKLGYMSEFEEPPADWSCDFLSAPDDVKCAHCGYWFETETAGPPNDDE